MMNGISTKKSWNTIRTVPFVYVVFSDENQNDTVDVDELEDNSGERSDLSSGSTDFRTPKLATKKRFNMPNPDDILTCPYNRAHTIVMGRMQFHLARCRKQHPNAEKTICPFNATHIVNKVELEWHLEFCKSRITGEREFFQVGAEKNEDPIVVDDSIPTSTGEVWGEEEVCGDDVINRVKEVATTKPTLSNKICASKAVRKQHKLDERRRFIEVNNINLQNAPALSPLTEKRNQVDVEVNLEPQRTETQQSQNVQVICEPLSAESRQPQAAEVNRESQITEPRQLKESPQQLDSWPLPSEQSNCNIRSRQAAQENRRSQQPTSRTPNQERWSGWKDVGGLSSNLSNINISEPPRSRANPWGAPSRPTAASPSEDFPSLPTGRGRRAFY